MRIFFLTTLFYTLPFITYGANLKTSDGFAGFVDLLVDLIQNIIYFIFALTIIVFFWKVIQYWIFGGSDTNSVEEGKKFLIAGIIGLFVMFSVWGLVHLFSSTFFGG